MKSEHGEVLLFIHWLIHSADAELLLCTGRCLRSSQGEAPFFLPIAGRRELVGGCGICDPKPLVVRAEHLQTHRSLSEYTGLWNVGLVA